MPVDTRFYTDSMIQNFPSSPKTVHVEIIAPTAIRGEHVAVGDVFEVFEIDADDLVSNRKARIVDTPVVADEKDRAAQAEIDRLAEGKKAAADEKKRIAAEKKASS